MDLHCRGNILWEVLFVYWREEFEVYGGRERLEEFEGGGDGGVDGGEDAGDMVVVVEMEEFLAELDDGGLVAECRD